MKKIAAKIVSMIKISKRTINLAGLTKSLINKALPGYQKRQGRSNEGYSQQFENTKLSFRKTFLAFSKQFLEKIPGLIIDNL
jgi:hypothetical protein